MIVSFHHSFAFIAIPRTGTHAIRSWLRPMLASNDWEQCTRYEQRLCPVPELATIGHGHLTAGELQQFLIPGLRERLFFFAFVRDPLDRFVSAYSLLYRDRPLSAAETLDDMKALLDDPSRRNHILFRPQAHFVLDAQGRPTVDFVGRYDRFEQDLGAVSERLELPLPALPQLNAAPRHPHLTPDAALRDRLHTVYAADYALPSLMSSQAQ